MTWGRGAEILELGTEGSSALTLWGEKNELGRGEDVFVVGGNG